MELCIIISCNSCIIFPQVQSHTFFVEVLFVLNSFIGDWDAWKRNDRILQMQVSHVNKLQYSIMYCDFRWVYKCKARQKWCTQETSEKSTKCKQGKCRIEKSWHRTGRTAERTSVHRGLIHIFSRMATGFTGRKNILNCTFSGCSNQLVNSPGIWLSESNCITLYKN